MTKLWVIGANGQLGSELREIAKNNKEFDWVFSDLPELDICKGELLKKAFKDIKPNAVINAAAYTAVDLAENEAEKAYAVNTNAVALLAELCQTNKAFLVHLSTDFVFDGKRSQPYHEEVAANAVGTYAASKYKGEIEILLGNKHAAIIRTSWLYGKFGQNFMKTILEKGRKGEKLQVVFDQVGTPTWSADLAQVVLEMVRQSNKVKGVELFHYSNEGVASWYDFAWEILTMTGSKSQLTAVESKDFQRPAPRPAYSVLNKKKIKMFLGISIPYWKDSLKKCMESM
ncbi:MAG: dTDP-4-dehydrorhamnose reductase [Bacteroidetes bacterium HGW-Bacteroidetes-6]|jgi:dTDP-4-dehydrorhamnose reductase|nr:MAG: dTDP-4-dehydrorhamnose reductase [Bacteroidetes bacterium HGW-Bacteroidetes-6]